MSNFRAYAILSQKPHCFHLPCVPFSEHVLLNLILSIEQTTPGITANNFLPIWRWFFSFSLTLSSCSKLIFHILQVTLFPSHILNVYHEVTTRSIHNREIKEPRIYQQTLHRYKVEATSFLPSLFYEQMVGILSVYFWTQLSHTLNAPNIGLIRQPARQVLTNSLITHFGYQWRVSGFAESCIRAEGALYVTFLNIQLRFST